LAVLLVLLAGCRQNMHNQNKVEPYEPSPFFADGQASRPLPAGTVARGDVREGSAYTGLDASNQPISQLPFPVTRADLLRGQERYDIFCSPCHGRAGEGLGMIVRRGFKQPTSFHDERLRSSPVGYFYNVITEGFGVMPSYAPQIPVKDRWQIAAYIRALQYSQNARLAELPAARRAAVEAELRGEGGEGAPGTPRPGQGGRGVTRPGPRGEYDERPDPSEVPDEP
jgi:mono/diheme cytochrome c family protein